MDWTPVYQAVVPLVAGLVGLCTTYITVFLLPRLIANREKETGIKMTDQQKAAIYSAAETEANMLQAAVLHQRVLATAAVNPNSDVVDAAARKALARVPNAAVDQDTTVAAMRDIIAGRAADKIVSLAAPPINALVAPDTAVTVATIEKVPTP